MIQTMNPPIVYYGGKQKMAKYILPMIPKHVCYVEPFVGGGATFWLKPPSQVEVLNDLNGEVCNFYRVLQCKFEEFELMVRGTLCARSEHEFGLEIRKNPEEYTDVQRAWAFYVNSNLGFAGIIDSTFGTHKTYGRMQSHAQTFRVKKERMRTLGYSERLDNCQIESQDALKVINRFDSDNTFHYCDPPYYQSDCGHYKGYTLENFTDLLETLSEIKGKFLLSCYPCETLNKHIEANGWHSKTVVMNVNATNSNKMENNQRKTKTEVLTWNYTTEEQKQAKLF